MQLIFVFTYAKSRFSHDTAHICDEKDTDFNHLSLFSTDLELSLYGSFFPVDYLCKFSEFHIKKHSMFLGQYYWSVREGYH